MTSPKFHKYITRPTRATLTAVLLCVNLLAAAITLLSAYGGYADPSRWVVPALLSMMLPGILMGDVLLMVLDFVTRHRRMIFIVPASWLLALPPLLVYSPVNMSPPPRLDEAERAREFTLLTYNVLNMYDFRGDLPHLESNATIDYILSADADIVNLQEAKHSAFGSDPARKITRAQERQLRQRYPYRIYDVHYQLSVLSKFPLHLEDIPMPPYCSDRMALFSLDIRGHRVHLFNVHLESIGLSDDDKELYGDLFKTHPRNEAQLRDEVHEVRTQLVSKLSAAFTKRVSQARFIRHVIDSIGGDIIVAGDFNDIQGCYAVRTIMGRDLTDAYARCALGPCITYHGNRFYFRIDQVLYGGDLEAIAIKRGDIGASDHFPLLTTFLFDPPGRHGPCATEPGPPTSSNP